MISALGVVVPAHNEESLIGACLRALGEALDGVGVPVKVCVVADRCTDATGEVARAALPGTHVLPTRTRRTLGEVRGLGAGHVLHALRAHRPESVWLLGTDADSRVPPGWAGAHLRHAAAGADAVTGLVDLGPGRHLTPDLLRRYRALVAAGTRPLDHDHVHGANFGVRASAFLAVGGYRPLDTGEDRDLWFRLRDAGFATRQPLDPAVLTSSRLTGRARGGLADLLAAFLTGGPRNPLTGRSAE
ncbi:glycosyltransferase [Actinokineospora sp.]|uniref:glycosyltransferase n=1 Tax=Actinokineospora sp. TaxID=1872133 RepID=UPI00403791C9